MTGSWGTSITAGKSYTIIVCAEINNIRSYFYFAALLTAPKKGIEEITVCWLVQ